MESTQEQFERMIRIDYTLGEIRRAEERSIDAARKYNRVWRKRLRAIRDNYAMVKRSYQ